MKRLTLKAVMAVAAVRFLFVPAYALTDSGPIVVNGGSGRVISGLKISNPGGPCIKVQGGATNLRIENVELTNCRNGIELWNAIDVLIKDSYVHHNSERNIMMYQSQRVTVENNRLEFAKAGVYALESSAVKIRKNRFYNISVPRVGEIPTEEGQMVQFNRVNGGGSEVTCNVGENVEGESQPEDNINLYNSNGTAADPIRVQYNRIKGGGPSQWGGGILLGDGAGSYQTAEDNVVVYPGQYGVAIAGGNNNKLNRNKVFALTKPWNNVGLYIWSQYGACHSVEAQGNEVYYFSRGGGENPQYNNGNCGTVAGYSNNNWHATYLNASLFDVPFAACGTTGSDTAAPTVPANLAASAVSSSQINLTWSASTDNVGVTGYRVFRNGSQITTVAGTTFNNTGLSPSTAYSYTVVAYDAAGNVSAQSAAKSATTQAAVSQGPYPGPSAHAVPGTIEAENFDVGGEGLAYHDMEAANQGNVATRPEGVDVETCSEGGANASNIHATEWLEYTVNVAQAGNYDLDVRAATDAGYGGTFHVEFGGVDKTGPMTLPPTGGWQSWTTIQKKNIALAAGTQVMRLAFDSESAGAAFGNINWLRLTPVAASQPPTVSITAPASGAAFTSPAPVTIAANASDTDGTIAKVEFYAGLTKLGEATASPYTYTWTGAPAGSHSLTAKATDNSGATTTSAAIAITYAIAQSPYPGPAAHAVPGTIEAENFDIGGEGLAYHDMESANQGNVTTRPEGVDVETCLEGGANASNIDATEWLEYTVQVAQAGSYDLEVRVAAATGYGGTFHLEFGGVDKTGAMTLPSTGGWQIWTTIQKKGITLAAGTQVLRLAFDSESAGGAIGNINWLRLTPATVQSRCDVNGDGATNVADVQLSVNQVLGHLSCTNDLDRNGHCTIVDVQRIVNAATGSPCVAD